MRPRHRGTGRTRSLVHRDAAHRHRRAAPHRRCARAPRVETREERLGGQTMVEQDMTMQGRHWHNGNCPSTMPTRRANHGARHTTAHFPSRPKNHTAFLGLYGKMRRHPPCAVVFLPRVSIFPIEKTCRATPRGCQWLWLTAKTALVPPPARLPNRERYHTVAQHQHRTSTHVPTNLWRSGQSGNPLGRLRGSRNKLSEAVICALLRDFRLHGQKAVARVRQRSRPPTSRSWLCWFPASTRSSTAGASRR